MKPIQSQNIILEQFIPCNPLHYKDILDNYYCQNCNAFLCSKCNLMHIIEMQDHQVLQDVVQYKKPFNQNCQPNQLQSGKEKLTNENKFSPQALQESKKTNQIITYNSNTSSTNKVAIQQSTNSNALKQQQSIPNNAQNNINTQLTHNQMFSQLQKIGNNQQVPYKIEYNKEDQQKNNIINSLPLAEEPMIQQQQQQQNQNLNKLNQQQLQQILLQKQNEEQIIINKAKEKANKVYNKVSQYIQQLKDITIISSEYEKKELDRFYQFKKMLINFIDSYLSNIKQTFKDSIYTYNNTELKNDLQKQLEGIQEKSMFFKNCPFNIEQAKNFLNEDFVSTQLEIDQNIQKIQPNNPPKFCIRFEYLSEIKQQLVHYISLILPQENVLHQLFSTLNINISDTISDKIPIYIPEKKKVFIYSSISNQLKEISYTLDQQLEQQHLDLMHQKNKDNYSFVPFLGNLIMNQQENQLFLICPEFYNKQKSCFLPSKATYKIHLDFGIMSKCCDSIYEQSKSTIIKYNNYVFSFGGCFFQDRLRLKYCQRYDMENDQWDDIPQMKSIRLGGSACLFRHANNKELIYIFGGIMDARKINQSIEVFDPEILQFTRIIEKNDIQNFRNYIPRHMGFCLQINEEQIIIFGGLIDKSVKRKRTIQLYNISTQTIIDFGETLPNGIWNDQRVGQPVIMSNQIYIVNSVQGEVWPKYGQRAYEFLVVKIKNNEQLINEVFKLVQ